MYIYRYVRNARQTMLKHKMAHGSGINPEIPTEKQVEDAMADFAEDYFVPAFGDGSLTTPKTWWAALGGYGVWIPGWNKQDENEASRKEEHIFGPTIGQTGSSTRHELMAWLVVLSKPIRTMYATDSAAMLCKAKQLLDKAAARQETKKKERRSKRAARSRSHGGFKRTEISGR